MLLPMNSTDPFHTEFSILRKDECRALLIITIIAVAARHTAPPWHPLKSCFVINL